MRPPAPDSRPVALTIAGSDSGGGAGIQADLATMAAHGVYGTSAITAVTAQHTRGVESTHVLPREEVAAQIDAVTVDFAVAAAKTGMLATADLVELAADRAADASFPVVVDPVMVATSGDRLLDREAERAYEALIGEAALVTPNADEAAVLTDGSVEDEASARRAGEALLDLGAEAALVKGGHVPGETVRDVLVTDDGTTTFEQPRVDTDATHGSGCALSAAIAARLADGDELAEAVERATAFVATAIRYHYDVGRGPGAVNHCVGVRNDAAREPTAEAVRSVVDRLGGVAAPPSSLIPDEGIDVAGATPFADGPGDVAALESPLDPAGRDDGSAAGTAEVRFGASTRAARALLAARERDGRLRFAARCRFAEDVDDALAALEWSVVRPGAASTADGVLAEGRPDLETVVAGGIERSDDRPVAVIVPDAVEGGSATVLLATDTTALSGHLRELAAELR